MLIFFVVKTESKQLLLVMHKLLIKYRVREELNEGQKNGDWRTVSIEH